MWEARCDVVFNNILVDIGQVVLLAKNHLIMEIARTSPPNTDCSTIHPRHWVPPPKGCLKLNVDVSFKEGEVALAVLARDEARVVQGLWFERASLLSYGCRSKSHPKCLYNCKG